MLKTFYVLTLLTLGSSAARADALLDFVDAGSGAQQARLSISGTRLRFETAGSGAYTIVDLASRTLTQVNAAQRTSTTTSVEQVQQLVAQLNRADPASSPLLQLAMDNLPDAQRRETEKLLRQAKADEAIPYVKTGQQSRVAGIGCELYRQQSSSGDTRSLCAAPFAALQLGAQEEQTLRGALQLLRETGGPWLRVADIPGLPIRYSGSFGNDRYGGSGQLQSIQREALPAARFSAPREYRIVSLLEMMSSGLGN